MTSLPPNPGFILLHVAAPATSASFYERLLGKAPLETSPTFVMFALAPGLMLGLWSRDTVEPATGGGPGASELGFPVGAPQTVDALHADWTAQGVRILQAPTDLDFGRSFVGLDPDGHRLRVFAPAGG